VGVVFPGGFFAASGTLYAQRHIVIRCKSEIRISKSEIIRETQIRITKSETTWFETSQVACTNRSSTSSLFSIRP
jgi:hypothetical protein